YCCPAITDTFNYDSQGAHFTALDTTPYIGGNPEGGFRLQAVVPVFPPTNHTFIRAEMTQPARAVGVITGASYTLSAFDSSGQLIGSVTTPPTVDPFFAGIVSDVPIALVIQDSGSFASLIPDFYFKSTPEPSMLGLAFVSLSLVPLRRVRRAA